VEQVGLLRKVFTHAKEEKMRFATAQKPNISQLSLLILAATATACSTKEYTGEPCENHLEATYDCAVEAAEAEGEEVPKYDDSATELLCDSAPSCMDDYYDCVTEAYASNNCSTEEGVKAAATAMAECTMPDPTECSPDGSNTDSTDSDSSDSNNTSDSNQTTDWTDETYDETTDWTDETTDWTDETYDTGSCWFSDDLCFETDGDTEGWCGEMAAQYSGALNIEYNSEWCPEGFLGICGIDASGDFAYDSYGHYYETTYDFGSAESACESAGGTFF